jgi:hypothetical protein
LQNFFACGGYARADIVVGGVANGIVAVFNQYGTGKYMFSTPTNVDEVTNAIRKVYPNIGTWLLSFIRNFL